MVEAEQLEALDKLEVAEFLAELVVVVEEEQPMVLVVAVAQVL